MREDEQRHLESVRRDLLRDYAALREAVVNARFDAIVEQFSGAPVRSFVPVLAAWRTRTELGRAH